MTVRIEGKDFSLFKEYDRAKLPSLTYRGKIRWFDERTRLVLVRPLEAIRLRRKETTPGARASFILIFGATIFGAVEALGGFYRGRDGTDWTFKDFVKDFMHPVFHPYCHELRDHFRNGLTHGFAVKSGGFEFQKQPLRKDPTLGLELDPEFLLKDFKRARSVYLRESRNQGDTSAIGKRFVKRFHDVFEV